MKYSIRKQILASSKEVKHQYKILNFSHLFVRIQFLLGISKEQLSYKTRHPRIVRARWFFYLLADENNLGTCIEIGNELRQDHCTVLYGIKEIKKVFSSDRRNNSIRYNGQTIREIYKRINNEK